MVEDRTATLDGVFQALAHPVRRSFLERLARAELSIGELAAPLDMSFAAASKHVRVLEKAHLVRRRVAGRQHLCRLEAGPLKGAADWTEGFRAFWESRFEALDELLETMKTPPAPRARGRRPRRGRRRDER